jgi:hypothetical protein
MQITKDLISELKGDSQSPPTLELLLRYQPFNHSPQTTTNGENHDDQVTDFEDEMMVTSTKIESKWYDLARHILECLSKRYNAGLVL